MTTRGSSRIAKGGTNNYQPGRSVLTDPNPQGLLHEFGGIGTPANNVTPGKAGFRERVDFGKTIGNYVDQSTGQSTATNNGIIHYGNNGAHIVPSGPTRKLIQMKAEISSVTLSINRGLWGEVQPSLLRVEYTLEGNNIDLYCFFENLVTEADIRSMRIVGSSVAADFPNYAVDEHCLIQDVSQPIPHKPGRNLVFLRK